jgi:hypothetical protein
VETEELSFDVNACAKQSQAKYGHTTTQTNSEETPQIIRLNVILSVLQQLQTKTSIGIWYKQIALPPPIAPQS